LIGGDPHSMGIGWSSSDESHDAVNACKADSPSMTACDSTSTYEAVRKDYKGKNLRPCSSGSAESSQDTDCYYFSPQLFFAHLDDLECNTKYLWQVKGEHEWRSFKTPACVGEPIDLAVTADPGQTNYSADTMDKMKQQWQAGGFDVVILPGDLSYANGNQPRWDSWARLTEPLFGNVPTSYTVGNHEYEAASEGQSPTLAFERRYPHEFMAEKSGSSSNLWYSYDAGLAHVIMLCSYCDYKAGSPQYTWLLKDLEKLSRERTPWLVAAWHTPWYTSNKHHTKAEGANMKAAFEDHLHQAGVDVALTGHVHAYERTFPVYNDTVDECSGTVHITVGDGGNAECFADSSKSPGHPWVQYDWSANKQFTFGHGRLRLRNTTHAEWEFFANEKFPEVHDHVWLLRGEARVAACAAKVVV